MPPPPLDNRQPPKRLPVFHHHRHRSRQVLELVAQGLNNQQIGQHLGLSPKTIARHRERIMNKLNMHSRTELVKFAIRTGLVKLN